jgi:DNA repair protein RecN (Recombination protein N)
VLVVTHLAQVAARADAQIHVSKSVTDGQTYATARSLDPDDRIDEIARMLSGSASDTAREHARELLG